MPHKHIRKEKDQSVFDLPPSEIAKPLPVTFSLRASAKSKSNKKAQPQAQNDSKSRKRKRRCANGDDTPRSFKRLMALASGRVRSGLDDGISGRAKKTKEPKAIIRAASAVAKVDEISTTEVPKIRPGEKLGDFSRRVDAALPLSGLVSNGRKDPLGFKVWKSRREMKLHKLYDQWRKDEAKIQAQREEMRERAEEEELEHEMNGVSWKVEDLVEAAGKGKKKQRRTRYIGEIKEEEEDPWEVLKRRRQETRPGLHDVAKTPPELTPKPVKKLAVRGSAAVEVDSVPKAAGSLRRREELHAVREDVVESYRRLMVEKRPGLRG